MRKLPKKTRIFIYSLFIGVAVLMVGIRSSDSLPSNKVNVIQLEDDSINPVTADYIIQAIDKSYAENARLLVIQLDTPGGLLSSTRLIVKKMLTSKVPIVVYISPSGSRAGSAGVFITYASHVAAMAPSTNIGAAHPVKIGEGTSPQKGGDWRELKEMLEEIRSNQQQAAEEVTNDASTAGSDEENAKDVKDPVVEDESSVDKKDPEIAPDENPMESKLLNDTVAFIKSIAQERNRNVEWAIQSVAASDSITSDEALKKGVVEIVATDLTDLMTKLDGYVVKINGKEITLDTKQVHIERISMDARQQFFNILANPNIAYFLMILGFYGLLFEVTHPGIGAPGIIGAIFLILAFYSMQTLPTNYAGLALLILGLILLITEAYTPTFGLLTLGGVVCMVLGSMLLFDSADPIMRVSKVVIGVFAITTSAISLFLITYMLKNQRKKAKGGVQRLLGAKGEVKRIIIPGEEGKVFVSGELWNATAGEEIAIGDKIIVESVDGMLLTVKKYQP